MGDSMFYGNERIKQHSRGEFKCAFKYEMILLAIAAAIMVALIILALPILKDFVSLTTSSRHSASNMIGALFVVGEIVFGSIFAFILNGRTYRYEAGETEFVVTGPGNSKEFFYYSDVQDIRTEELKLFGKKRGYLVTITTGVREVQYRYIFGRNKVFTGVEGTPFYYLGLNSGLYVKTAPVEGVDSELISSQLESMMVEQITAKNRAEMDKDFFSTKVR